SRGIGRPRRTLSRNGRTWSARVGPPNPIINTASHFASAAMASARAHLVNRIDQRDYVIDRRLWKYSVAEIEDMSGASARLIENRAGACADFGNVREQRDRIEIALHRHAVIEPRPRVGEIDAPIEPQNVAARLAHQLEQVPRHGPEMNDRHVRGNRR